MKLLRNIVLPLLLLGSTYCTACQGNTPKSIQSAEVSATEEPVTPGANRPDLYLPLLEGRRVALLSNHTGMVNDSVHTLDTLLASGINVTVIFSPEHGFRGKADAGQHVSSSVDPATGIPIASLYDGKTRKPAAQVMDSFDVLVVDLQDVGLRFYTYYITMLDMMRAAAEDGKSVVVLDRPNPNGMIVDGPMLKPGNESGVGRLPLPVFHGMTMGELARMIVGERWLGTPEDTLDLTVIPVTGYRHSTKYDLPVPPSPNLPDMQSVRLYGSLCLFEGTPFSLGRGTDRPFQMFGHPALKGKAGFDYTFTPQSRPGATNPPQLGKLCYGRDLGGVDPDSIIAKGFDLTYVIEAYRASGLGKAFFKPFFRLLAGSDTLRDQIMRGMDAEAIRRTWQADLEAFRKQRAPYLLYPEE